MLNNSNNVAIGRHALMGCTTGSSNVVIGYNAIYKKYYILSCQKIIDTHASKYCSNIDAVSLLVLCNNEITHHIKILPISVFDDLEHGYKIYKKIIPSWLTLYLSLNHFLGPFNKDIFVNIAQYYVGLYFT